MTTHTTLGQTIDQTDLFRLLEPFSKLAQAKILSQIKDDPTIQGFIQFQTCDLSTVPGVATMPFGPNCTLKSVDDARGRQVHLHGYALTNPGWPVQYATIPEALDQQKLDLLIAEANRDGWEELPCVWAGRKRGNGVWIGDTLRSTRTGGGFVIVTIGDTRNHFLVCAQHLYSRELVDDPTSPSGHSVRNHHCWFWEDLPTLVEMGYEVLERQGMPIARFVLKQQDERA